MSKFVVTLHTLNGTQHFDDANFTVNQRAAILHMLANAGRDPVPPADRDKAAPILLSSELREQVKTSDANTERQVRELAQKTARLSGYTGDMCGQCGSTKMRRNGSCLLCEGCGNTTGCS